MADAFLRIGGNESLPCLIRTGQSRVQLLMLCEYLFFRYIETYGG